MAEIEAIGMMKGVQRTCSVYLTMFFFRLLCFAGAGFASLDLALGALVDEPMRARVT